MREQLSVIYFAGNGKKTLHELKKQRKNLQVIEVKDDTLKDRNEQIARC